jgi:capsular exopolysaccharide synthesis family protein
MELREYLHILRRRWVSVLVIALVVLLTATAVTFSMTKQYTATTRLFFAVSGTETVTDLAQGSTFAEKQMTSYAQVATSPLVLDPVIRDLGLATTATRLAKSVSATIPTDTVILDVAATSPDPEQALRIANAIASQLSTVAGKLTPERPNGSQTVKVTTLASAQLPEEASSPNVLRNLSVGLVLGLLLGIGIALMRHILDTKVRSEADIRAITDSPVLGVVGYTDELPKHPVIVRDEPLSASSEEVRRLRTNLQFIDFAQRPRSIVVTSSIPTEGKSTIAINLAVSLADAGARIILVDADLRRPAIAEYAGLEGAAGLTSVLIGRAQVADVVQPLRDRTLDVLPSGPIPPNPSELLGSTAMAKLLEGLTSTYDIVLLDSPPVLPVTDAAVLSKLAGGALVVVGADRIHRPQLLETLELLNTVDAHVLGLVVNKISRRDTGPYGYETRHTYQTSAKAPNLESYDRSAGRQLLRPKRAA